MNPLRPGTLGLSVSLALGISAFFVPQQARAQNIPSYATTEQTIHGRIRSVDAQYHITVVDDNGYLDSVTLHQGTIINPTGLTLSPGMSVTIMGYNGGSTFEANQIDTPYNNSGPRAPAVSYAVGFAYPGFAFSFGYGSPYYGGYARYPYYGGYARYPYGYCCGPSYGFYVNGGYGPYRGYGYRPYGYPYRGYPGYINRYPRAYYAPRSYYGTRGSSQTRH